MIENANKEVIQELERLHTLLENALEHHEYAEDGCKQEYREKIGQIVKSEADLGSVPSVFKKFPVFPIDKTNRDAAREGYNKKKSILFMLLGITVVSLVVYFLSKWDILNMIGSAGVIGTIIFYFNYAQSKKDYETKEKAYTESVQKSEKSFAEYRAALRAYDAERAAGIAAAKAFAADYRAAYEVYDGLLVEMGEQREAAFKQFVACMDEAKSIDFVPSEYYGYVAPMITMLKSGRADSYKEALNMAIEEERQAQAEKARLAEEARRTRIMEEQAAAERQRAAEMERHNRQMEEQQQMQAKMMLDEQRKQARDAAERERKQAIEARQQAMKAESEARRQAEKTKQAGISRCASCANSRHCPSHVKNNGSGLTCGSYRPYGA